MHSLNTSAPIRVYNMTAPLINSPFSRSHTITLQFAQAPSQRLSLFRNQDVLCYLELIKRNGSITCSIVAQHDYWTEGSGEKSRTRTEFSSELLSLSLLNRSFTYHPRSLSSSSSSYCTTAPTNNKLTNAAYLPAQLGMGKIFSAFSQYLV